MSVQMQEAIKALDETVRRMCLLGQEKLIISGYKGDEHKVHSKGVIVRNCSSFFFNGSIKIHEGEYEEWLPHPLGVLGRIGRRFYLNGELVSDRDYDDWFVHPLGVLVTIDNRIFLNGRLKFSGRYRDFVIYPEGILVRINDKLFVDGTQMVHCGECDSYFVHPEGFAVVIGNRIILNDTKVLFEGDFEKIIPHQRGLLVKRQEGWFIDGRNMACSKRHVHYFEEQERINDFGAVVEEGSSLMLVTFLT